MTTSGKKADGTTPEPRTGDGQLQMFDDPADPRPGTLGHAEISYKPAASILTKASGFMGDYDYTLNPYAGCSFGCTYCYAAFFTRDVALQDTWGRWVSVKENAVEKLRRMRADLSGARVYMSSVTDPYQPIERTLGLVRELLPILAERGVRLVVQTRSSLVTRDIDLFKRFEHLRVNVTVTTDLEEVRREFEPWCPTTSRRLAAVRQLVDADLPTCVTMTPLLPVGDAQQFAQDLLSSGCKQFVVQPFHPTKGRFVAGTGDAARSLVRKLGWDQAAYSRSVEVLRSTLPHLEEGREGFAPA